MDTNVIDALIAGCPIFSQLNSEERSALAESSALVTYRRDDPVFSSGDTATQFFVIAEGAILIRRREDETRTRVIAQFITGESFGEMDVLRSSTRNVEAIASTESTLLVIPAAPRTFSTLVAERPIIFAGVLRKLIAYVAGRIRSNNDLLGKGNAWIEEIRRQVYTDKLTGLFNTTYLKDALFDFPPASAGDCAPGAAPVSGTTTASATGASVLAFKPDRFKDINDTFGHEVGDRTIQLLSRLFRETITPIGSPIRYRGNEFLALLPGHTVAQTRSVAERLIAGVSGIDLTDVTNGTPVQLTVSIGIASADAAVQPNGDRPAGGALVRRACKTMMNARDDGGDRIYHYRETVT